MYKKKFEPKFFKLRDVSNEFNVEPEVVIDLWLNKRISLYIKLEGVFCTIVRYSFNGSYQAIKDMKKRILDGYEKYQYSKFSDVKIRYFKPSENENINSEIIRKENNSIINDFEYEVRGYNNVGVKFIYNGIAKGYWKVVPTKLTHFERERYLLSDMTAISSEEDESGAIIVNDYDSLDFLKFSERTEVDRMDLYIHVEDIIHIAENNSDVTTVINESDSSKSIILELNNEVIDSADEYNISVLNIKVALYVVICEHFRKINKVIYNDISIILSGIEMKTTATTVKGWVTEWRHSSGRRNKNQEKALSFLLILLCEEINIQPNYLDVDHLLNDLINKY
ncbi:hypothetical protein RPP03_18045, partial [Salmonella enterica subsp. enterica serovar Molade]|uniref:hypothetical protein n=1 Tax=Salmonella enterica TaxID=28901 RepID=UPI0030805E87